MTFSTDRIPADPVFCKLDPGVTQTELIKSFSDLLGKTIFPAQYEYLLNDFATYLYTLAQISFQYTGEQSLVNYATGSNLDQLGALLGVVRLPPAPALVTMEFRIATAQTVDIFIHKGTRIRSNDTLVIFDTLTDVWILGTAIGDPVRNVAVQVQAQCEVSSEAGNPYIAGTISTIIDTVPSPIAVTATNVSIAAGGIGLETDDRFRRRIKLAPASFSVAGSINAYEYFTLSASATILDVSVVAPDANAVITNLQGLINGVSAIVQTSPDLATAKTNAAAQAVTNSAAVQATVAPIGQVLVYLLTASGAASAAIKTLVTNALNALNVRPLTDQVMVTDPTPLNYTVAVQLTLFTFADAPTAIAATLVEVKKITDQWGSTLGADIVPEQLISAIVPITSQLGGVFGVYRALLTSPTYQSLGVTQWANLTATPTVTVVGVTTG